MLPHPEATSKVRSGPRTSDLSIERRRRNHFTTAPLVSTLFVSESYYLNWPFAMTWVASIMAALTLILVCLSVYEVSKPDIPKIKRNSTSASAYKTVLP